LKIEASFTWIVTTEPAATAACEIATAPDQNRLGSPQ